MTSLVTPQQLAAMAEAKEVNITALRDEVAKIAYTAIVQELGTNATGLNSDEVVGRDAKMTAKISFDFAEAFMRERYERESVARAMTQPNFGKYPGNPIS